MPRDNSSKPAASSFGVLMVFTASLAWPGAAWAEETPAAAVDFARDVMPIFAEHCYDCHGPEASAGGLRLNRGADALGGGDNGEVIVPGKSAESKLMQVVAGSGEDGKRMPPQDEGEPLSSEQIAVLRAWIDQGAAWPGSADVATVVKSEHWAFQPLRRALPPAVKHADWPLSPIDAFILTRLEAEGVAPSPDADRPTLLKRVSLDLRGLPPTPEECGRFVGDTHPAAYERMVDRMLASPHYGERFGRHWLDLARYADSDGYEKDSARPHAWRYRHWLIRALNDDLPFDQFTVEQLAGDLLPQATTEQRVATGFHRNTLTNREGGIDPEEDRVKQTVDRLNTTGATWLGLTVGCAQCHSHKFDPISQREYYGLYAFFNSLQEADIPAPLDEVDAKHEQTEQRKDQSMAQTLAESASPRETRVLIRGDFLRPGAKVSPGTPEVLPPLEVAGESPTRLDLARWLVDPAHPLTPRVTVNRAWHQLFGRGIVETNHDFGTQGSPPSHPELLDWLASEFIAPPNRARQQAAAPHASGSVGSAWSLKSLHRAILSSATYRQSSQARPELIERDPYNKLLARQNRLRVEAEVVRDLALSVSGLLEPRIGGASVRPPQPAGIDELAYAGSVKWQANEGADRYRRGLYTFFQRTVPFPMFMDFDAPDSNVACTRRERSNTPIAALTLQNDPVFVEAAQAFARRLLAMHPGRGNENCDDMGRARAAALLCLGRINTIEERTTLRDLHREALEHFESHPDEAAALCGPQPKPAGASDAELAAWTLVGRTLLNLDEFITRE